MDNNSNGFGNNFNNTPNNMGNNFNNMNNMSNNMGNNFNNMNNMSNNMGNNFNNMGNMPNNMGNNFNNMGNMPNMNNQSQYNNGNMNYFNQNNQTNPNQMSFNGNGSNNNSKKVIAIVIALIVLIAVIIGIVALLNGKSSKGETKELPKSQNSYNVICTKSSEYQPGSKMTLSETVGLEEIKDYGYISYSYVQTISKDDGSAILENENNIEVTEEIKQNLTNSGYTGISAEFKDGKIYIKYGMSNYSYSNAKEAKKVFEDNGYKCK